jgi:hypothetical protein
LPKYSIIWNPLLTSNGTIVLWDITHTSKTRKPIIQLYDKNGMLITTLSGLILSHKTTTVGIQWNTASNVAANEYYVVLIG